MLIIFSPMPRQLRIEYPGAIYHVMNRGDQREDIFADDDDRRRFRSTLEEACTKTEWQVHACTPIIIVISRYFPLLPVARGPPPPVPVAAQRFSTGLHLCRLCQPVPP